MPTRPSARPPGRPIGLFHQTGVALVVALIFLVILTLLGIAALGNNTLQTRMTYSVSETNLAFQSTETALSAGENWLATQTVQPATGCATLAGTAYTATANCSQTAATAAYIWPRPKDATITPPIAKTQFFDENFWTTYGRKYGWTYVDGTTPAASGSQPFGSSVVNETPRYVVEELGPDNTGSLVQGQGRTYRIYDYQITARSYGAQSTTRVVTQSVYGKGY